MLGLLSDIVCTEDFRQSTWEAIYKLFEDEGPKVTQSTVTIDDSTLFSNTTYNNVDNYFLHRNATTPKIFPYTNMIFRVKDNMSITNIIIFTNKQTFIGSFSSEDL